jgi:hypothetical protein
VNTLVQLLPINRGFNQIVKIDASDGRALILNGSGRVATPFVRGRNPEPMSEAGSLQIFVQKLST